MTTGSSRTQVAAQTTVPTMVPDTALAEYATLKEHVRETLILGQQRIEAAKVVTYWRTGWYIQTHIRLQTTQAERYGMQVVERLGRDLDVNATVLRRCAQFAEQLPQLFDAEKIRATWRISTLPIGISTVHGEHLLTWSHYRVLLAVPDDRKRAALLQEAVRNEWPVAELEARVRRTSARSHKDDIASRLLTPLRGTPGLFPIKDVAGTRYWDLGFESYRELSSAQARAFKAGDLVRLNDDGALVRAPEAKPAELYTYAARVVRVVDGDTLWLLIRLCGADWRQEKVRLRGIDCPELSTAAGVAAKRYVQQQLQRTARLLITTTKPDQWDRYLSDVFLTTATGEEVFLNNRLLETRHARLYTAVSPEDWDAQP